MPYEFLNSHHTSDKAVSTKRQKLKLKLEQERLDKEVSEVEAKEFKDTYGITQEQAKNLYSNLLKDQKRMWFQEEFETDGSLPFGKGKNLTINGFLHILRKHSYKSAKKIESNYKEIGEAKQGIENIYKEVKFLRLYSILSFVLMTALTIYITLNV